MKTNKEQTEEMRALVAIIAALTQPAHAMSLDDYEPARAVRIAKSREGDVKFAIETARQAIAQINEKIQANDALDCEFKALTDRIDMQNDEFRRIEVCAGVNSEIKGLCQRAQKDIKQNIPIIDKVNTLRSLNKTLVELLYMAVPYVEEGEEFNKPSAPKLSKEVKDLLVSLPKA